jgi:hypothetical protein
MNLMVPIYCDSQSTLAIAEQEEQQSFHSRFKHLSIWHLHITDSTKKKLIWPLFCLTKAMVVDMLMKALPAYKLTMIKELLDMNNVDSSIVDRKGVETGRSSSGSSQCCNSKE